MENFSNTVTSQAAQTDHGFYIVPSAVNFPHYFSAEVNGFVKCTDCYGNPLLIPSFNTEPLEPTLTDLKTALSKAGSWASNERVYVYRTDLDTLHLYQYGSKQFVANDYEDLQNKFDNHRASNETYDFEEMNKPETVALYSVDAPVWKEIDNPYV